MTTDDCSPAPSSVAHWTRRETLQWGMGTCLAVTGAAVTGLARPLMAAPAPQVPIVDTHTHFYDPQRPEGVPWPGKNDSLLYRTVLPAEYQQLAAPLGVVGTVVVEASPWVADNQWILNLAEKNPFLLGLVGNLAPGSADFREHFPKLAQNPKFRGIRVNATPLQAGLASAEFVADLKKLHEHNLELDVNGGPSLLPLVNDLAQRLPGLRIVINHLANVKIDGPQIPAEWLRDLQACARHPQVRLKVSALVEGAAQGGRTAPSDPAYYRPILDAAWATFGEDRVIYGSNWPVSARYADYATVQKIVQSYVGSMSKAVQQKFFHDNAYTAYQWPVAKVN